MGSRRSSCTANLWPCFTLFLGLEPSRIYYSASGTPFAHAIQTRTNASTMWFRPDASANRRRRYWDFLAPAEQGQPTRIDWSLCRSLGLEALSATFIKLVRFFGIVIETAATKCVDKPLATRVKAALQVPLCFCLCVLKPVDA